MRLTEIVIRPARPADRVGLDRLIREQEARGATPPSVVDPVGTLEAPCPAGGSPCVVAVDGETVVGFATWSLETPPENGERCARLETLHLREDLRGSGVGRRLFDRAAADAAEVGAAEIRWRTSGPSARVLTVHLEDPSPA